MNLRLVETPPPEPDENRLEKEAEKLFSEYKEHWAKALKEKEGVEISDEEKRYLEDYNKELLESFPEVVRKLVDLRLDHTSHKSFGEYDARVLGGDGQMIFKAGDVAESQNLEERLSEMESENPENPHILMIRLGQMRARNLVYEKNGGEAFKESMKRFRYFMAKTFRGRRIYPLPEPWQMFLGDILEENPSHMAYTWGHHRGKEANAKTELDNDRASYIENLKTKGMTFAKAREIANAWYHQKEEELLQREDSFRDELSRVAVEIKNPLDFFSALIPEPPREFAGK